RSFTESALSLFLVATNRPAFGKPFVALGTLDRAISLLRPHRQLVAARILEMEAATARKRERLLGDAPTRFTNPREGRVENVRVQDDQRSSLRPLQVQR